MITGPYKYALIAAAALGLLVATYGLGYSKGKAQAEIRYVKSENKYLKDWTKIAARMADSFAEIAAKTEEKKAEVRYVTKTVIERGAEHVKDIPREQYTADEYIVALRLCSYDTLYKAGNTPLPASRQNATCPPPLPGSPKLP